MSASKLTPTAIEQVIGALSVGADMALAAKVVGMSRSGLRKAASLDPELRERIDDARALADEVVIKSLYTMATVDKNVTAAIFWLKNRQPQDWRDRKELMFGVTAEQAAHMSIEELDAKLLRMGVAPEALQ